ncbi:MAG: MotA/TolQ/ExbB proton channel family protein, partial [Firmicutes bacterium]|nr:MotA/TolQ/ExbB proton channel family protein [Bacillota bacterium]
MDLTSIVGVIVAVISLVVAFVMEGGSVLALIGISAGLIVIGGTVGAVVVSFPGSQLKTVPALLKRAFFGKSEDPLLVIEELVELATIARREGILALEDRIDTFSDDFMKNGIRLVVDGVDPELVRGIMETELSYVESRHESGAAIFESAGGYAPTMGILGTVMGLIHVLGNLTNVSKLGPL